jgi:hypothetical protein
MAKNKLKIFFPIVLLLAGNLLFAQASDSSVYSINLNAFTKPGRQVLLVCNKTSLKVNEEFELRVMTNFAARFIDKPQFNGMEVVAGPMSNCRSVYKNGNYVIYQLFGYKLRPVKSGTLKIGPVLAYTDSAQFTSNIIELNVEASSVPKKEENASIYTTMLSQAGNYSKALVTKDYNTVMNYTFPKTIERLGGRDSAIQKMKRDVEKVERNGTTVTSITLGKPMTIYKAGNELHCMVPMLSVLQFPAYKWFVNSCFLAISKDGGKTWCFIDTTSVKWNPKNLSEIIPSRNPGMLLPKPVYLQQ